jgi:hypothetical protein
VEPGKDLFVPKTYLRLNQKPITRKVVPKYPKESQGCYAVAAPIIDGKRRGNFMKPFNYTLKTLVSYKVWKQAVSAEITK